MDIFLNSCIFWPIYQHDYSHADKLAKKYMGLEKYPFKRPGEKRITFKIKPEHVYMLPEISMNEG